MTKTSFEARVAAVIGGRCSSSTPGRDGPTLPIHPIVEAHRLLVTRGTASFSADCAWCRGMGGLRLIAAAGAPVGIVASAAAPWFRGERPAGGGDPIRRARAQPVHSPRTRAITGDHGMLTRTFSLGVAVLAPGAARTIVLRGGVQFAEVSHLDGDGAPVLDFTF